MSEIKTLSGKELIPLIENEIIRLSQYMAGVNYSHGPEDMENVQYTRGRINAYLKVLVLLGKNVRISLVPKQEGVNQ
jgi:hypothetical protein